jgi:hypothetical protein
VEKNLKFQHNDSLLDVECIELLLLTPFATAIAQLYTLWNILLQLFILVGANLVFARFTTYKILTYCHMGEHKVRPYNDNVNWMASFTYVFNMDQ